MPTRLCIEPKCPNPATARGRCDVHRKAKERDRSRARREEARDRNRMYASKRWAMFRKRKLFLDPLCQLMHPGCRGIANEVHHKVAIEDGGEPYSFENVISTCKPCHSRETRREVLTKGSEGRT